jgi:hypothetical protein
MLICVFPSSFSVLHIMPFLRCHYCYVQAFISPIATSDFFGRDYAYWQVPDRDTLVELIAEEFLVFWHNPSFSPMAVTAPHELRRGYRGTLRYCFQVLNPLLHIHNIFNWTASSSSTKGAVKMRDSGAAKMCGVCGIV